MKYFILAVAVIVSMKSYSEEISARTLLNAIRLGEIQTIQTALDENINFESLYQNENRNRSILEEAVHYEKLDIVKLLLAEYDGFKKYDLDKSIKRACATNIQNRKIVDFLISKGGDINAVIEQETSCLYSAAISADADFYSYLLSRGANPDLKIAPREALVLGFPESVSVREIIDIRIKSYTRMKNNTQ